MKARFGFAFAGVAALALAATAQADDDVMVSPSGRAAMQTLEALMAQAEALEAKGLYREAAEKVANGLSRAHAEYVQSKVPGVSLVRQPTMAMPRRSYVERYKARLRVDWQKWDRCSRMSSRGGGGGLASDAWGDEEEEQETAPELPPGSGGSGSSSVTFGANALQSEAINSSLSASEGDWQPETLAIASVAGEGGDIELVHTCCDGKRISTTVTIHASFLFNGEEPSHDDKDGVKGVTFAQQ